MIDYESLLNHEIKAVKPSGIRKFFDIAKAKHGILQIAVFLNCARKFVNGLRENIM